MHTTSRPFTFPDHLSQHEQVTFARRVIEAYRAEILPLRQTVTRCQTYHGPLVEQLKEWRNKYKKADEENHKLHRENERLRKEKDTLKREIERLTKTNTRYQVALFDNGNFKGSPDTRNKKPKGGQRGHADTNRETQEPPSTYPRERLFVDTCATCGTHLSRVPATRQKTLIDIIINPQIVKLIVESERQWCSTCKREVYARDDRSLPFTEYGINTFMLVVILRFKAHASMANIATVLRISHGLTLSKSEISNMLKQAKGYLRGRYENLIKLVRSGAVMYMDETGWLVNGHKAWMWIMANEQATVYIAAESRGKGIAEDIYGTSGAYAMTDGLSSYLNVIPKERHLYCWTHILRFCYEETIQFPPDHPACRVRDRLVSLYQTVRASPEWSNEQKEQILRRELDSIVSIVSQDPTVNTILHRVRSQKEGLILALLVTINGTNNLAERELRTMAIKRTISNGSATYQGMETTAVIGSVVQTLGRTKDISFLPALKTYFQEGMREKYRQYIHSTYYDSS